MPIIAISRHSPSLYANAWCTAVIALADGEGRHFSNLYFSEERPLPAPRRSPSGRYDLFYRSEEYPHVVDLLRSGQPVYLHFNESHGALSTRKEAVGDEELQP